jgi:hypothetical protein
VRCQFQILKESPYFDCVFKKMSTAASNPLLNDIRYKEGLKCMNSGMYEEAIELLCSLSEEWLA